MAKKFQKILISTIIFAITFVNYGLPIQSIASEGQKMFKFAFFHKDEISLNAYFEEDSENTEKVLNVNDTARLTVEINPLIEGYFEAGSLELNLKSGKENNFKIKSVTTLEQEKAKEELFNSVVNLEKTEDSEEVENVEETEKVEEKVDGKVTVDETKKESESTKKEEKTEENVKAENEVTNNFGSSIFDSAKSLFLDSSIAPEEESAISSNTISSNTIVNETNTISTKSSNTIANETNTISTKSSNTIANETNTISSNTVENVTNTVTESTTNSVETENVIENTVKENAEEVKPEDGIITEKVDEPKEDSVVEDADTIEEVSEIGLEESYEVKLKSDNEIQLKNIIEDTKIFIDIEYNQNEKINAEDLYSEIIVALNGNYINEDLERIEIFQEKEITVGWEYTKEIEISSNYTKVSPFTVGENFGTIVENVITIKRDAQNEKSLPIKQSNIKIEIPKINDKLPKEISVSASKLMATLNEDVVRSSFIKNSYSYDEENGVLEININNNKSVLGNGEDVFNITCRYEDYIEDEKINLNKNVQVKIEEYSSNSNVIQEKVINEEQEIEVKAGELISYFVSETEEKINKGKINANYYLENKYETEFSNIINLNILTSDILDEILLQPSTDSYVDNAGNILDASGDVKYKGVKFKTSEIQEMLEKGSTIDLLDGNGNVFHTISKENSICAIIFSEKIDTVQVRINDVRTNGNIKVEFVKAIENCQYAPEQFKEITKISSEIDVNVRYAGLEENFALPKVNIEKAFSESYTQANLSINRQYLSTVSENENVELKIELNNHLETSDFYKNPSFEMVFPIHVKEVKINNVYTLYQNGLSIKDYQVVNDNGVNKIIINFEGIQTELNSSSITNGTNIIVNVNIVVDEITPRKEDEIKLYYCNEAATNYQTQTDWSITKEIPEGILKDKNGFDSKIFEYQAPTGLITINSIINYDGTGQTIKSIKQGDIIRNIPILSESQNSTMELVVLNNTGNECIETVLLGRIPFKGNKDVETGKDLGTNVDTIMKSALLSDSANANTATIYYSSNPDADRDLEKISNGWVTNPLNQEEIKSFMLIIDGTIAPGEILKYRYDFEIPANLGYDAKILGSFGAFYNKKSDNLIVYETSVADKVGLVTETGPKLEATLSVDVGNGTIVKENDRLKYTITINNIGSVAANDLNVKARRPGYTNVVTKSNPCWGDFGYLVDEANNMDEFLIPIETLNPGESQTVSYYVKTGNIPSLEEYSDGSDENGYYRYKETNNEETVGHVEDEEIGEGEDATHLEAEKEYITEVPKIYITNKVSVTSSLLTEAIETNEVTNELTESNFDLYTTVDFDRNLKKDMITNFAFKFRNISGKKLENVSVVFTVEDLYSYKSGTIDEQNGEITFDENQGKLTYKIGSMEIDQEITLTAEMVAKQIESGTKTVNCYFEISADGIENVKGTEIPQTVDKAILEAKDISILLPETLKENEELVISTQIDNIGALESTEGIFEATVSEYFDVEKIITSEGIYLSTGEGTGVISAELPIIYPNESLTVDMHLKAVNTEGTDANVAEVTRKINNVDQESITLEPVKVTILNTEKTEDEIEQDRIDKLKQEYEEQKKQEEEDSEISDEYIDNNEGDSSIDPEQDATSSNDGVKDENQEENNLENDNMAQEDVTDDSLATDENNNSQNNNNNVQQTTKEEEKAASKVYTITGSAWLDTNKNGTKDNEDKALNGIKVYLLTPDNRMLKSTITNSSGAYQFNQIENGKYIVAAEFDEEKYAITTYKKSGIPEEQNSDIIKSDYDKISALTNEITISNANIGNVDIGLQNKDSFDLSIKKYISKATIETSKRNESYNFENLEMAKVELKAKEIDGAKVTLEYTIVLENVGNIEGYAEQIVDFVNKDMKFDESKNTDWVKGNDGYVYVKNATKVLLEPGDKKEFKLILTKEMTEDNVGTVSNKASILKTYNSDNETENTENNTSIQNTVILISTGYTLQIVSIIGTIILLTMLVYIANNKKRIKNNNHKIEIKINQKKFYK